MEQQEQQQQPQQNQKSTPARRRGKRPVNSPAHKTYASENDVPSEGSFPMELAGPSTPQKPAPNSPVPSSQLNHSKSKPRSGNKLKAKQVSSPGPAKQGRTTPPPVTAPKPVEAPAFAGATFHASPAPSSLPIPSFLSKALDSPSAKDTDRVTREPSPPATDSEAPTPQHRILTDDVTRRESPLDIFFRADRAEKERARRASSANILGPSHPFFSPPAQIRSPAEPKTLPGGAFSQANRRSWFQRDSPAGIPASELNGIPGRPLGPAFSTPYQDRIRAARSGEKQGEPLQKPAPLQPDPVSTDMSTRRIACFLGRCITAFGDQVPPDSGAVSIEYVPAGGFQQSRSPLLPPGPADIPPLFSPHHPAVSSMPAASASTNPDTSRSAQLLHMEDSLRRLLKLTPASTPEVPAPANGQGP
ncbi:02014265-639e-46b8-a8dc-075361ded92f [Thermothielavioides terrestris]|uniref:02014265-639e-46b8-a8dc-075361ded92f n=1 Tax=Thermothielavioides terrestris TaxID=2587410 RepID=A0A446BIS0_9PEZI|nr:02014265-639e-46b8-a8dc-075361ded92f [Thermothielavioides terrestris]